MKPINRFFKKPPIVFPLAALFHVIITAHAFWLFYDVPFSFSDWLHPLSLLIYTLSWLFVCNLKKWAAYIYIAFTSINILLRFFAPKSGMDEFQGPLFPLDIIFCFFLFAYFKRFN